MSVKKPVTNPGNAKIERVGHTATSKHGSDPNAKAVMRPAPRDLRP